MLVRNATCPRLCRQSGLQVLRNPGLHQPPLQPHRKRTSAPRADKYGPDARPQAGNSPHARVEVAVAATRRSP